MAIQGTNIKRNITSRLNFRNSKNFTLASTLPLSWTVVLLNVFLNLMAIFKRQANSLVDQWVKGNCLCSEDRQRVGV